MAEAIAIDGTLRADAAVPVLDRGFLYGDSAFEVLRTYGGRPFAMAAHLARLRFSCDKIGIPLAPSDGELESEIASTIAAGANAESYVRVIVTRGITAMGLDPGGEVQPRRIVIVLPLTPQPASLYSEGIEIGTVALYRALDATPAAGAKASNYLPNILSLAQAKRRGAYEAIAVGPAGELIEGTTSNLFVVRGRSVLTPPLRLGLLSGITRKVVLEVARAEGLDAREALVFPPDLYGADEAFITSTLREVAPAVRADGAPIGSGKPGPITARLLAAYRKRAIDGLGPVG